MAHPHRTYQPRDTAHSVLHAVIRDHLEPFLREGSDRGDGSGLPFSCKRRGFCPSCGGRRMAARADYLVDEELPRVPVRQWVLTLPYRLRYRLAWGHALCRTVLGVYARVLLAFYARTARSHGIQAGRTGTVTVIQRFGSGLQASPRAAGTPGRDARCPSRGGVSRSHALGRDGESTS